MQLSATCHYICKRPTQGSKIALVRSYLQVPQAAGQVKILIFLMKIKYFPIYANNFCDAGQVLILRYFEAYYMFAASSHLLSALRKRPIWSYQLYVRPEFFY